MISRHAANNSFVTQPGVNINNTKYLRQECTEQKSYSKTKELPVQSYFEFEVK